jgi:hypothetical protein
VFVVAIFRLTGVEFVLHLLLAMSGSVLIIKPLHSIKYYTLLACPRFFFRQFLDPSKRKSFTSIRNDIYSRMFSVFVVILYIPLHHSIVTQYYVSK